MKRLIVALFLCLMITGSASCHTITPIQGVGAFLQKSSLGNQLAWSSAFDWFIVDSSQMSNSLIKSVDRPLVMSYSGQSLKALKKLITLYAPRLVAVVWEYGPKNTVGLVVAEEKRLKAEANLSEARLWANKHGLAFGVITVAGPDGSARLNGVYFDRLHKFADFVMPCVYSQWWGNRGEQTRQVYAKESRLSRVPVIPLATLYATSDRMKIHEITPDELIENFYGLLPSPAAIGFYNLSYLDDDLLSAIISIGQTLE